MVVFGLSQTIDRLSMKNSVCWCGQVLNMVDGHFLRRGINYYVEDQRKEREAVMDMEGVG